MEYRVFLEKLIVAELVKKFPTFMKPTGLAPCSVVTNLGQMNPICIDRAYFFLSFLLLSSFPFSFPFYFPSFPSIFFHPSSLFFYSVLVPFLFSISLSF